VVEDDAASSSEDCPVVQVSNSAEASGKDKKPLQRSVKKRKGSPGIQHTPTLDLSDVPDDIEAMPNLKRGTSTSRYRGVCRCKRSGPIKWQAQISVEGINYYLGLFDSEEEAGRVYAKAHHKMIKAGNQKQRVPAEPASLTAKQKTSPTKAQPPCVAAMAAATAAATVAAAAVMAATGFQHPPAPVDQLSFLFSPEHLLKPDVLTPGGSFAPLPTQNVTPTMPTHRSEPIPICTDTQSHVELAGLTPDSNTPTRDQSPTSGEPQAPDHTVTAFPDTKGGDGEGRHEVISTPASAVTQSFPAGSGAVRLAPNSTDENAAVRKHAGAAASMSLDTSVWL